MRQNIMHKGSTRTKKNMTARIACLVMSFVMAGGMAGCGKENSEKVPELVEPVSTNEAYRPVTYGDNTKKVIKTGTIVPTDYCYYYDTSVTLSKVYVNVGDEVKKDKTVLGRDRQQCIHSIGRRWQWYRFRLNSGMILQQFPRMGTTARELIPQDVKKYSHEIKQKIYEQNQMRPGLEDKGVRRDR